MDEETKKAVAVFRYGVIADLANLSAAEYGKREKLLREKSAAGYKIPGTYRTRVSKSSIKHWLKSYLAGGGKLEALYPRERVDCGRTRALSGELAAAVLRVRKEMPAASIPRVHLELQKRGIAKSAEIALSTLYRMLHQAGKMKPEGPQPCDRRRFEAENPNDLWQSDALHGPHVTHLGRQKKTYLLAIIDDHSRLVPHGEFYFSEGIESYLDCLRQGLLKRGMPRKLYVDNGAAFRSGHLEQVMASLGITLSHSEPGVPLGLVGKKVTLLYHPRDLYRIEVRHENQNHGFLQLLDLQVNARARRERTWRPEKPAAAALPLPAPRIRGGELPLGGGENHE